VKDAPRAWSQRQSLLELSLPNFQGPAELLLLLIRREELDPLEIPMAQVVACALRVEVGGQEALWEIRGRLLWIVTLLLWTKSRALLLAEPKEAFLEGEEEPSPEILLAGFALCRKVWEAFEGCSRCYEQRRFCFPVRCSQALSKEKLKDILWLRKRDPSQLRAALGRVLSRAAMAPEVLVPVERGASVAEKARWVLRELGLRGGPCEFATLFFEKPGRLEVVSVFLAVLELVRQKKIRAWQSHAQDDSFWIEMLPEEGSPCLPCDPS
jgi:segregation and condensation protein A